jgi:hypothetical protein
MMPLGPGEIRARNRPLLIAAVAAGRLLLGLCLAWPLASLLGDSGIAQREAGDRVLFENGGYLLLELVRLQGLALLATARGLLPLLCLGLLVTVIANGCLLVGLESPKDAGAERLLSRALRLCPALLVVGVATVLVQGALFVVAATVVDAVPEPMTRPVEASLGRAALWSLAALAAGAVGGFADMVKASLVRARQGLGEGWARARRRLRSRPLFACFGWIPYGAGVVVSASLAAAATEALDVSRPGDWRVVTVLLLHQLVILASVALRAAWYARALRFVASDG